MKIIIYILIFFTFEQLCFGQQRSFFVPTYENGDTTFWFKRQQAIFKKAGLKDLTNSTDTLHFRYSSENQIIDVWTSNYLTFSGTLTNFTTKYNSEVHKKKKENADKFISERKTIDSINARHIYELFKEKSIFEIPPQDSIKDWNHGEDGNTYFIELSTKNNYSFKDYWTPSHFKDKVVEAKRFYELTERLELLLNLKHTFMQFIDSLPNGMYKVSGMIMIVKSKKNAK